MFARRKADIFPEEKNGNSKNEENIFYRENPTCANFQIF